MKVPFTFVQREVCATTYRPRCTLGFVYLCVCVRRVSCGSCGGLTRECLLTCSLRVNSFPQMSQLKERTPE